MALTSNRCGDSKRILKDLKTKEKQSRVFESVNSAKYIYFIFSTAHESLCAA